METLGNLPLLVVLLCITTLASHWFGGWMRPAPLMSFQWLVVCSAAMLLPHGLRPVTAPALLLVLLAVCAFVGGALLAPRSPPATVGFQTPTPNFQHTTLAHVLLAVALLGLPLFLLRAADLADSAPYTESAYINLRIALTGELDDAQSFGLAGYLIPVAFSSALVELALSPQRRPSHRFWLALLLAMTYAVMATGRTYVFLLGIGLAFVCVYQGRLRLPQMLMTAAGFLIAAFIGLGWLANKIGVESPNADALAAGDALVLYLLGSLSAMDLSMAQPIPLEWGANTLRSFLAVGQALGMDVEVPELIKPYVYIPQPTNVYTVFLPYWRDFGWLGVVTVFAFFGWAQARLDHAARRSRDPRTHVLAAIAMYPLLMQFFQDQYFSLLTTWVTFVLLIWPCVKRRAAQSS